MNDFMIVVLTDAVLLLSGFLIPTILLKGFFWTWFRVRTSWGKFVLVEISEVNRVYFKKGEINDGFLQYKDAKKEKARLKVPTDKPVITRKWGVSTITIDAETGAIVTPNFEVVSGFDQVKFEDLYERALYRPGKADPMIKILIFVAVAAALAAIAGAYFAYSASDQLTTLSQQVAEVSRKINSGTIVGGKLG